MIGLLVLATALGAEPGPIPADRLAALGLGAPTAIDGPAPVHRYPLLERGFATVARCADAAEADRVFDGLLRTAATHWPPTVAPTFAVDRSAGDGAALVLVKVGTTVVMVRDGAGDASAVASAILAAMPTR